MHYNQDDGCFYGNWILLQSQNHPHPLKGKGEAIIYIEDAIVDKNEITRIIERIAERSRREYCEEIETYEFLAQNQISLFDTDNSSPIKSLSKFSSYVRKK